MVLVMLNGKIVDSAEANVSVWDRGYYFGDGVYEVIQAYNGKLWGVTPHFRRFERSLREIGIPFDVPRVERWVREAFAAAGMDNCVIYWQVTRGRELRSHTPGQNLQPQFFLYVKPAPDNRKRVAEGVRTITYPDIRWKRCDIKSLNLLPNVMASEAAAKVGAEEALFVSDGIITEGASSCFFGIFHDKLVTYPLGHEILPSVTRQAVLVLSERAGIQVVEQPISVQEAYHADELFTSSSGHEIRPVVKVDEWVISKGKPGPRTAKIIELFLAHTRGGESFDNLVKDTRFALLPKEEPFPTHSEFAKN
jgi:D-alanine transaminase